MELHEIDWASLRAAYGSAGDVPHMLAQLNSENADECGAAISDLWGCLCHQGTVYEASAAAVPFLFEAAKRPTLASAHRTSLLGLIVHVGIGEDACWNGYTTWDEVEQCASASALVLRPMLDWALEGCAEARTWVLPLAVYNPSSAVLASADLTPLLGTSPGEVTRLVRCLLSGEEPDHSDIRVLVDGDVDLREYYEEVISELPLRRQGRLIILELAVSERL